MPKHVSKTSNNPQSGFVGTLDSTHQSYVEYFEKKKSQLPKQKKKLDSMKKKLEALENKIPDEYTNDDIRRRSKLKTQIVELTEEIDDTENNDSEMDYYSRTVDILTEYYAILEGGNNARAVSQKDDYNNGANGQNNIMDFFNTDTEKTVKIEKKQKIKSETKKNTQRSSLYDDYMRILDFDHAYNNRDKNYIRMCNKCDIEKTLVRTEGMYVCRKCGEVEYVIIESEKPAYKDQTPEKTAYPYKRINHFNELFASGGIVILMHFLH
jgi:hypothetical protein